MKTLIYISLLISMINLASCKEEDLPPSQGMLYLTLNAPEAKTSANSISIEGVGTDSILYDSISSETFLLPMPVSDNIAKYKISFNKDSTNADIDILEIYTSKEESFKSYSEGVYYVYNIDSFKSSTNAVDSAHFIYNIIDQKQYENIRLFYSIDTTSL
ncbi:MAG: DUF6452 family protein [Bacteroidales bacterium]